MFGLVSNEEIILASGSIMIPKYRPLFKRWTGDPILNTFGNKPLIDVHGVPCFAELAILSALEHEGWQGRWVETYGSADNDPKFLTGWDDASIKDQHHVPIPDDHVQELLQRVAAANGSSFSGCWDVIAWNSDRVLFAEGKHFMKDHLRATQKGWLSAGLSVGLSAENFLIVEWSFGGPA